MIGRVEQLLQNETLSGATLGTVYTSRPISFGFEAGWILIARITGSLSGTSPSIIWEVDQSTDGAAFTRVGGAIAAQSAAGIQVTPYYTGTTQGLVIASPTNTHTYSLQVKGTLNNADNVINGVFLDLISLY